MNLKKMIDEIKFYTHHQRLGKRLQAVELFKKAFASYDNEIPLEYQTDIVNMVFEMTDCLLKEHLVNLDYSVEIQNDLKFLTSRVQSLIPHSTEVEELIQSINFMVGVNSNQHFMFEELANQLMSSNDKVSKTIKEGIEKGRHLGSDPEINDPILNIIQTEAKKAEREFNKLQYKSQEEIEDYLLNLQKRSLKFTKSKSEEKFITDKK